MEEPVKVKDKRLESLQEELAAKSSELEAKIKEEEDLRDQLLRLKADFENAKKRWIREQAEFQEQANRELLTQFLEIHDDFERALAAGGPESSESFRAGVEMIAKRLESFLKSYGVVPMEAQGKPFDPAQHEAVAHEETDPVAESTVLAELRKGYLMNGKVLRHAVVTVAVRRNSDGQSNRD